jgi:creatinine amidohydrolase
MPVGATEQHGPHLPLGTDLYIASYVAREVSERDDLLLLPEIPVGVSSEHRQFWGTLTLPSDLLSGIAVSVARALSDHGLNRLVFVNGHGSNCAPLDASARTLVHDDIHVFVFNWWQAAAGKITELFPDATAHAGSLETSLMLAIHPDWVRQERISEAAGSGSWGTFIEGVQVGFDAIEFSEAGNVGDPRLADPEKGRAVLTAACGSLSRFCSWLAERTEDELASKPHRG